MLSEILNGSTCIMVALKLLNLLDWPWFFCVVPALLWVTIVILKHIVKDFRKGE